MLEAVAPAVPEPSIASLYIRTAPTARNIEVRRGSVEVVSANIVVDGQCPPRATARTACDHVISWPAGIGRGRPRLCVTTMLTLIAQRSVASVGWVS